MQEIWHHPYLERLSGRFVQKKFFGLSALLKLLVAFFGIFGVELDNKNCLPHLQFTHSKHLREMLRTKESYLVHPS